MKIIRKAPPPFSPFELACPHCHALLMAESLNDFRRVEDYDQRENKSWACATTKCPGCNNTFHVSKSLFTAVGFKMIPEERK